MGQESLEKLVQSENRLTWLLAGQGGPPAFAQNA